MKLTQSSRHGAPIENTGQAVTQRQLFEFCIRGLQLRGACHHSDLEIPAPTLESRIHCGLEIRQIHDPTELVLLVDDVYVSKASSLLTPESSNEFLQGRGVALRIPLASHRPTTASLELYEENPHNT
jgi:hypothetical protein